MYSGRDLYENINILDGLFYRPPNVDNINDSITENSIHLAVDTNVSELITQVILTTI